jgi:hypothetical protein
MSLSMVQDRVALSGIPDQRFGDLVEALLEESRMIDELRHALLRQRAGVAADDVETVEASLHSIGRTLLTLEEARRRRGALTALITGGDPAPLESLEEAIGVLPANLAGARSAVKRAAMQAAQEIAINQHVLRRAIEAGEAFLQHLFSSAADPAPNYGSGDRSPDPAASGFLLNRTA